MEKTNGQPQENAEQSVKKENFFRKNGIKVFVLFLWLCLILVLYLNRDRISIREIVNLAPQATIPAMLVFLLLFAVKGVSVVIYAGVLFAASGIVFSLPLALSVNLAGCAVMVSVPYAIGRKAGAEKAGQLLNKYPKLKYFNDIRKQNDFYFSFLTRIVHVLPSDPVSLYLGASGTDYRRYLCGSVLGILPELLAYTILGSNVEDRTSPAFWISAGCIFLISVISILLFAIKSRKQRK